MRLDIEKYRRGTHVVDRELLSGIPVTPRGDRSSRWSGIQHAELAETVIQRVQAADLLVTGETWSIGRGGAHLFGYIELKTTVRQFDLFRAMDLDETGKLEQWHTGYGGFKPEVTSLRMGVIHSNDSSFSLRLVVVPIVLVCSNGMTVEGGSIACQKKHTTGLQLVEALDTGIQTYLQRVERIDETIETLREIDFGNQQHVDHLLVEAGRRQLFPWSKLGKVEKAWREPPHPEFRERNGWSLYNAFTEVSKEFSMHKEMESCDRIRRLIISENPSHR